MTAWQEPPRIHACVAGRVFWKPLLRRMQGVLEACGNDLDQARLWLLDMDPFVAECSELPEALPMYADEANQRTQMHADELNHRPAHQPGMPTPRPEARISSSAPQDAAAQHDVYWLHRRDAVRLSREWRRLFRRRVLRNLFHEHALHCTLPLGRLARDDASGIHSAPNVTPNNAPNVTPSPHTQLQVLQAVHGARNLA
jgi:hypothetical protein